MVKLWKVVNDSNRQLYVGTMEECRYYVREKKCLSYTHIVPKDTPIITYEEQSNEPQKTHEQSWEYANKVIHDSRAIKIEKEDVINHPPHYQQGKIQCIQAIESATTDKTGFEGALVANIIKYLWRYESKGGLQDVLKARWYIGQLIDAVKEREENND